MVSFCRVRETPRYKRTWPSGDWGIVRDHRTIEDGLRESQLVEEYIPKREDPPADTPLPQTCLNTQCIFCLCNLDITSLEARFFCFHRPRKAREHVETQRLLNFGAEGFVPFPLCGVAVQGVMHFKNHAATVHNYFLYRPNVNRLCRVGPSWGGILLRTGVWKRGVVIEYIAMLVARCLHELTIKSPPGTSSYCAHIANGQD